MAEPEPSALDVSVEVQQRRRRTSTAFKVGDKVEMRPVRWYDDLYWLGTVDKINDDGTASVAIENGDTEPQVPLDELHLLPFSRKAVFEGPEVLVFDGHSLVPGEGEAGPIVGVRLLSFRSSPHLYQSGCLLNPDDGSLLWAPIAFEIIQAMSTTMAFLHRRTQRVAAAAGAGGAGASLTGPPYDSAWLGGGSGSCPQTCRNLFREYLRRIDVVELSPEVMRVAQQHFGLTEDESVKCHVADGAVFLAEQPANSYDLVAIDAADHDASDEGPYMEAPPAGLYSEEFLRDVLWTRLRPGGFIAVNAIGRREQYVEYGRRLKACGFWPIYIFAIDPNMVFFAWKSEVDPEEREQQQLASFFDKQDAKAKKGARKTRAGAGAGDSADPAAASTIAPIAEEKAGDDGLEDGTMDWQGFRKLITDTPGMEKLVPSVLGPVLDKTRQAHERKNILGWMGVEDFQAKCNDKTWVL